MLVQLALLGSLPVLMANNIDDICGYAPLCGQEDSTFSWDNSPDNSAPGETIQGVELGFQDCCSLRDTLPQESCQITNPSGEHYRYLTAEDAICGDDLELCDESICEEYTITIDPTFIRDSQSSGCCDSCTCFGDPQCISFDGTDKMWVLCDGRDIPRSSSIFERCWITQKQCNEEVDHAGNQCTYLSEHPKGLTWEVARLGSPCVPSEDSPASLITMYSVPDVDFELVLQQGERGVIETIFLQLSCGNFELNADLCLESNNPEDAWSVQGDGLNGDLPEFFTFVDTVHGRSVGWSVIDPDSGIALSIRCHGNTFDDEPGAIFVPRINVEDLADPVPRRPNTDGFCVSGEFDTGLATTANTEEILDSGKCAAALDETERREIYRAMCRNPALPTADYPSCVYHFCSAHYLPLYSSIAQCEATFDDSLAEGFCRAIVYTESDVNKCIEQWFDLGAVETIQQYYDDEAGCTTEIQESLTQCQSGIIIQYQTSTGNDWRDAVAIPDDFCSESGLIQLSYCDPIYRRLFNRRIRIVQKTAGVACGPTNQCKAVDAFGGFINLVKNTPTPTEFPTLAPVTVPTELPTEFPTAFPTPFPNGNPTAFPTPQPASNLPPSVCPAQPLCDHDNGYDDFGNGGDGSFEVEFQTCCPNHECPPGVSTPGIQTRWGGSDDWFCGESSGSGFDVEDSHLGEDCEDDMELSISITFSHDEDEQCCAVCKCYGDPRCYSFDGTFEEFILCDGRQAAPSPDERCVIRKDTCDFQRDHEGNLCRWYGPEFPANPDKQAYEENQFPVSAEGSPCRYDPLLSSELPLILMYAVDAFELTVEQGERGYLQSVTLEVSNGNFYLNAHDCVEGAGWETLTGEVVDGQFTRKVLGREILWTVYDAFTGISAKVRCTGHLFEGEFSTHFINVDALEEPDSDRIGSGQGFCATSLMPEKELASTWHSEELRDNHNCDHWNEDVTRIMKREVARIITGNPGVTNVGVEAAYDVFCDKFYFPYWSSPSLCSQEFLDASKVQDLITAFCKASSEEVGACEENLEILSEEDGYKEAFARGYELYILNFDHQCELTMEDLPTSLNQDSDSCETGAELQWFNPRSGDDGEWLTYAAFPDTGAPCSGYSVTVTYEDHPRLFKNPLRLLQKHDFDHCSSCTYASAVQAYFEFRN